MVPVRSGLGGRIALRGRLVQDLLPPMFLPSPSSVSIKMSIVKTDPHCLLSRTSERFHLCCSLQHTSDADIFLSMERV